MVDIVETIGAMVRAELGALVVEVTPDTRIADLGVDSLKLLRLVAKLEKRFGIELEDDVIFEVETLRGLADVIANKLA
ncbi:MAG: acyl carrier protein [Kofleriaceae bacterium]